ncbi:DUF1433 domain-containing protein [Bacillus paralicheniformis]|jgi:hypothetical protein|uniref:DUF1433 domain-containing protein n=2 Tax=Bacillus paralicheniformis TaxID=1648923 RepID=A0A7Z0WTC7_9BACI|nr:MULTISPECIES: DUF1433 domain-containing protein [Bacillus]ETB69988.1 hypothetical protein A943_18730 [Bacillus sp. CPSM8]KUL14482.1 hypothetical protein LI7559_02275 [Bacillus licheniformis LMG 7559]KUL18366.1 hypothetical protein LI6934_06075 [Bacillus licheniformis LMG 6934]POO83117.1 DUF1433 domain-containing protein [Bacillus sp. MBGLi97]ARA85376.1 hypothetical protein BLMD_07880 [Bacillus paralicheniformis]
MKKYIIILLALVIITFGGIFMKQQNDNREKEELYNLAKERMTDFIKTNYEDIKSIDYSDDYEVNPMGGIDIKGYLNGDKQKKIWGIYDKSNDEVGSFTVDAERKPECKDKICDY